MMAASTIVGTATPTPPPTTPAGRPLALFLYDDPHSEFCAKVKIVLYHKQLDWQPLHAAGLSCGSSSDTQFLRRVPLRKIPALVVQMMPSPSPAGSDVDLQQYEKEEVVLYESEVINEWLEEQYPQPHPMLPQHPLARAQARLISRFHDLYLEASLRKLYTQVNPATRDAAVVQAAGAEFVQRLQQLEQHMLVAVPMSAAAAEGEGEGGQAEKAANSAFFAMGGAAGLTLADVGYPALLLYAQLLFPVVGLGALELSPRLARWQAALQAQASVQKVLQELQPAAEQWLESKLTTSG